MPQLTSNQTLRYNAKDAVGTRIIIEGTLQDVKGTAYEPVYRHTLDLYDPLMYMMIRGIRVDFDALNKMKLKVDGLITQYQIKLNELTGRQFNANSPDQCKNYFYVEKGVQPYTKRKSKGEGSTITCDDKALQRLSRPTSQRPGFEEARIIQRIRQLTKLKGTYLDIVFDADGRMRCSYNPRGTRFGRLSSSKTIFETGMNMQNLPPAFQQFLVADEGKIFINLDKRQAEWVVMAYISGDEAMIHAIESGVDVHSFTASHMFGIPLDVIRDEHKILGTESDVETIALKRREIDSLRPYLGGWLPRNMSMRQCGKKSNHGLNYDESAKMFGLINEITEKEAGVIVNYYHRTYPGISKYYETVRSKLATDRTLFNLFGRPYHFRERWGPELFKSAYSYVPQSTVGELVNRAMDRMYKDDSPETRDFELMQQVHDNLAGQDQCTDIDRLVKSIRKFESYMSIPLEAKGRTFTIGTDLKVGFSMGNLTEIDLRLPDDKLGEALQKVINDGKAAA